MTVSALRKNPIPCKVCGVMFSNRIYRRYNCDLHYRQLTPEMQKIVSEKIRIQKTGSKRNPFSKEWKEKMSKSAQHGSKCHNWKNGATKENEKIRKSAKYVNWRKQVYIRDNYTCQICFKRGGNIEADHIKPFALYPELRLDLNNGRTLCKECHRKTPTYGDLRNYVIK